MVNKIILFILFLPCLCFSQNRLFDKSLSRYEANINTSLNNDVSLYGTYSLNEYIKPLLALNLHTDNKVYNVAPAAGIMFIAADERFAPYLKIQAGPNFTLSKGVSPGFFLSGSAGFQYALTNSTGMNFEVLYNRIKYPSESNSITNPAVENLGLAFGLNYRFGSGEKKFRPKHDEKSFFDKISMNVSATLNTPGGSERGNSYAGYNISGLYDFNDNLKFGAGVEYTRMDRGKYYSTYFTGMMQTSSKRFPMYARFSAGLNFSNDKSLTPGLMLSFAAGLKFNISDRIGIFTEFAMKNLNNMYSNSVVGSRPFGFSIGISIRLGK